MKLAFFVFIFFQSTAFAEYRVYQYVVKNKVTSSNEQVDSVIKISSLNPRAYIAYNGGAGVIDVELMRTWMCPGRTAGFKKLCPSPYAKLGAEVLK